MKTERTSNIKRSEKNTSKEVVSDYVRYVRERGADPHHHYAWVSVGKIVGKVLEIGIEEKGNEFIIYIIGDNEFSHNYYSYYNTWEETFISYFMGGLIIQNAKDLSGNSVQVEVAFKNKEIK